MILKPASLLVMTALVAAPAFAQNVATVNGKPIPAARVDQIVKQVVAQGKQADSPQLREAIKKDLINREVLLQEADRQGVATRPEVKMNPVKDADIKAEYDKYKAQVGDKEYHARHILVGTEEEAKAIIAKLKAGGKFEELAKQSKDGSAANGGDLDWASAASYVPEFSAAMVKLNKGQFTETPVKTQFGYHVIKLEDTRPAKVPSFDEVKQQVAESIQQKRLAAYRDELAKKAKIQ